MPPLAPAHLPPEHALEPFSTRDRFDWAQSSSMRQARTVHRKDGNMSGLTRKAAVDRSKINIQQPHEVRYWTRHLSISKEDLQKAVEKVGNAAAAVRKELGLE